MKITFDKEAMELVFDKESGSGLSLAISTTKDFSDIPKIIDAYELDSFMLYEALYESHSGRIYEEHFTQWIDRIQNDINQWVFKNIADVNDKPITRATILLMTTIGKLTNCLCDLSPNEEVFNMILNTAGNYMHPYYNYQINVIGNGNVRYQSPEIILDILNTVDLEKLEENFEYFYDHVENYQQKLDESFNQAVNENSYDPEKFSVSVYIPFITAAQFGATMFNNPNNRERMETKYFGSYGVPTGPEGIIPPTQESHDIVIHNLQFESDRVLATISFKNKDFGLSVMNNAPHVLIPRTTINPEEKYSDVIAFDLDKERSPRASVQVLDSFFGFKGVTPAPMLTTFSCKCVEDLNNIDPARRCPSYMDTDSPTFGALPMIKDGYDLKRINLDEIKEYITLDFILDQSRKLKPVPLSNFSDLFYISPPHVILDRETDHVCESYYDRFKYIGVADLDCGKFTEEIKNHLLNDIEFSDMVKNGRIFGEMGSPSPITPHNREALGVNLLNVGALIKDVIFAYDGIKIIFAVENEEVFDKIKTEDIKFTPRFALTPTNKKLVTFDLNPGNTIVCY